MANKLTSGVERGRRARRREGGSFRERGLRDRERRRELEVEGGDVGRREIKGETRSRAKQSSEAGSRPSGAERERRSRAGREGETESFSEREETRVLTGEGSNEGDGSFMRVFHVDRRGLGRIKSSVGSGHIRRKTRRLASDIPVLKEVEQIVDPALFSVVRFALTTVPFLPFILKAHGDSQTRSAGIELGLWVSLGYLSQTLGLLTSEAGRASFISAFTIIVVPFIDGIFGATVSGLTWSGALLSLVGVAILEYGGSPCVGDILNLMSAVFFGIHILRTEQISRSTEKTKFLALLGYEIFVVALSSTIWFIYQKFFVDGESLGLVSCTWTDLCDWIIAFPWIPAMYTGIFSTGLCLLAEMDAMCDVSATETAIIYGLEPVWGAAFAWFCLGERWGTFAWIGSFLVICGSLAVQILGEYGKDGSHMERSNEQKGFFLSTVAVNPKKIASNLFRKEDKL